MSKKPRDVAAGVFHVYTHCVWAAKALYRDDQDRSTFMRHLARVTDVVSWTCIAYCLMDTHYHLLVDVDDNVLPAAMHRLNLAYARDFNRRHAQRGHVQFKPYGADRIHTDWQLLDRFGYVVLNPVRANATRHAEAWAWSSYAGTIGLVEATSFVDDTRIRAVFGREDWRAQLAAYVAAQPPKL